MNGSQLSASDRILFLFSIVFGGVLDVWLFIWLPRIWRGESVAVERLSNLGWPGAVRAAGLGPFFLFFAVVMLAGILLDAGILWVPGGICVLVLLPVLLFVMLFGRPRRLIPPPFRDEKGRR